MPLRPIADVFLLLSILSRNLQENSTPNWINIVSSAMEEKMRFLLDSHKQLVEAVNRVMTYGSFSNRIDHDCQQHFSYGPHQSILHFVLRNRILTRWLFLASWIPSLIGFFHRSLLLVAWMLFRRPNPEKGPLKHVKIY